ncbi:hypothetical protein PGT21_033103 [Puccinia graminis f. sp. tritici]|uniref:Uncharacterized protein n=1 Tax=Puccinia graminis f. sp. tritici TaxID=56615 RepID=A0A5B0PML6_PUCGR|nr:hypothetical protein PGT21_033103 [Puccinia graminis f. sp. tritici]
MPPKKASRFPTLRSLRTPPKKKRATPKNTRSKKNDDELGSSQGHLKIEDYEIIIDWLRDKKNYVACFGDGKAPAIGRRPKAMINGYELMAIHLRNVSPTKINLTPRQMKDRFKSYKDKYKKAHTKSMSTGSGLTPADRKAGITTIEDKLENMCPLYAEMDEIFGNRPDVNPLFMADAEDEDDSSESSSEDNNSDSSNEMDEKDSSHSSESTAIHPLLKNATSQVNIVALEQENTGDTCHLPVTGFRLYLGQSTWKDSSPHPSTKPFSDPGYERQRNTTAIILKGCLKDPIDVAKGRPRFSLFHIEAASAKNLFTSFPFIADRFETNYVFYYSRLRGGKPPYAQDYGR